MNNEISDNGSRRIGSSVRITFAALGEKEAEGKVDTGATTSSMHAENIRHGNGSVSFVCPYMSDNAITMDLYGQQDVLSADGGNNERPMVKMDICVNGVELPGVVFNLNDRSEMDSPILVGQNIIKAGQFVIDLNGEGDEEQLNVGESVEELTEAKKEEDKKNKRDQDILKAVKILKDNSVTIFELVEFLRTAPLYLRNGESHESD